MIDKSTLTEKQLANWDKSIEVYTEMKLKVGADSCHALLMWNPPGHEKSALFRRLLDGKAPLPYRPPTSYSYPWYAPFDTDEFVPVLLQFMSKTIRKNLRCSDPYRISINQTAYKVVRENKAAKDLFTYYKRYLAKLTGNKYSARHRKNLYKILMEGPEWLVSYGPYLFEIKHIEQIYKANGISQRVEGKYNISHYFYGANPTILTRRERRTDFGTDIWMTGLSGGLALRYLRLNSENT